MTARLLGMGTRTCVRLLVWLTTMLALLAQADSAKARARLPGPGLLPWNTLESNQEVLNKPREVPKTHFSDGSIGGFDETTIVNDHVTFVPIESTFTFTPDATGCPAGFVGTYSFEARLTKIGAPSLSNLVIEVAELTGGNLLQNGNGGPRGVGARLTVPRQEGFTDGILGPDEVVDAPFIICLTEREPFSLVVDVLGISAQTCVQPPEGLVSLRPVASKVDPGDDVPISSHDDDPFAADSVVECMDSRRFERGTDGRRVLLNNRVGIEDEPVIYLEDPVDGQFKPFATNPWPVPTSNAHDHFVFLDEERFPRHEIERNPDGTPVLRDGLQVWKPRESYRGMTTLFEAANAAKGAAQAWSGRDLPWGQDNQLLINSHAFIAFNAFFSPSARGLFFGVVPYRLRCETGIENIKMFEMASSWEIAVHEAGHALHLELKPNVILSDQGYRTWGESFGDQMAMWTALRDTGRVRSLLAETNGDLSTPNLLSGLGEVFGALVGHGLPFRDAVHDKKVSDTSEEEHDRSEVLTGAVYRLFLTVYDGLKGGREAGERALRGAGEVMGTFLTRAADYTPENTMTLEDVAKAYLKVDREFYDSAYHVTLVGEFTRREIFNTDSVSQWLAHEAAVPDLRLPPGASNQEVDELVQANLDQLGIGPAFGLTLQRVTRDRGR